MLSKVKHTHLPAADAAVALPWLSVLIPVFNVEPYLRECVLSIVNQEGAEGVEILLLDDCSTDKSLDICRELAAEFPRQVGFLQHDSNAGMSSARNSLIEFARGEHIWFLDSDDYMIGNSLSDLKAILRQYDPDMVLCDYRKRRALFKKSFPGFTKKFSSDQRKLVTGVFRNRKMYAWLKISRRNLWDGVRFPVGKCYEDIATIPHLLLAAKNYYYAPQGWVYYRIRPNSIMTSVTRTPRFFDVGKSDDLADALTGYTQSLEEHFGEIDAEMAYCVSHFIGREFTKLARRYEAATNISGEDVTLRYFYEKMTSTSPLTFEQLLQEYLRRSLFWNYFLLRKALRSVHGKTQQRMLDETSL